MRDRGLRARMVSTCSAGIRCSRSGRRFANDVEAVFVLIAFRRSAQFSGDQPQADSCNEKARSNDHDEDLSKICTIIGRLTLFVSANPCCALSPGARTVEKLPDAKGDVGSPKSFQRTVAQRIPLGMVHQISDTLSDY